MIFQRFLMVLEKGFVANGQLPRRPCLFSGKISIFILYLYYIILYYYYYHYYIILLLLLLLYYIILYYFYYIYLYLYLYLYFFRQNIYIFKHSIFLVLFFRIMPIKSECLKISSQTSIIYVDQYFFYAMQHYHYTGITQCNQFYH